MAQSWLISTYVNNAARECSITPGSFVSPSSVNELSIRRALDRTVDELLDRHDWNQLTYTTLITGDGTGFYQMPAGFRRLCRQDNAVYELTPNKRPVLPLSNRGDWAETDAWNSTGSSRFYRLQGLRLQFLKDLPYNVDTQIGGTVNVSYVSNRWVILYITDPQQLQTGQDSEQLSATWTNNTEESLIPGVLLELGIIWRFKMAKSLPYADYKAEYESKLARLIAEDAPNRKLDFTAERDPYYKPMRVPVPDFIPPA